MRIAGNPTNVPARRLDEEDNDGQVPGECEVKALTVNYANRSMVIATEDFPTALASWSIGNSESFDEGDVCGKVADRTTSVTSFEQALERRDGRGFGNPLFSRVAFSSAGGIVDTEISSSTVTAISVTSLSGAAGDSTPAAMGYGQTFFISQVQFSNGEDLWISFPLLFHDPSGCLADDVDPDVYGQAVVGYGESLGGNVTLIPGIDDLDENLVWIDNYNTIMLGTDALLEYVLTQAECDVTNEPVWTEAGYALCSVSPSDGEILVPQTSFPNVTTSVNDCPISVLPARFMAIGDFIDGTLDSRLSLWVENFVRLQTAIFKQNVDAVSALNEAALPVIQSTNQVGFALAEANDSTEWVLVLVVAVESLFVVFTALGALIFSASNGFALRNGSTRRREWVMTLGSVVVLGCFLVLGLTPVFISWGSEREAAEMAHNDVYHFSVDESVCVEASWQGDDSGLGLWCVALRTSSESFLVRSYESTFEGRYAVLAISSAVLGGAAWMAHAVLKTFFVEKGDRSDGAVSTSRIAEARVDFET